MKKKIILASGSPRRRELLAQIGMEFEICVSNAEEIYTGTVPVEIVKELALVKASNVAKERDSRDEIVIGADTIVVLDDKILGKPADKEDAFRMLSALQGRAHEVYTGVAVLNYNSEGKAETILHAEETRVFVHAMTEEEILSYVASGEPMDKAGAYGIQGRFAAYIDRIEGDYFNVVGLPLARLYHFLRG